MPASDRHFLFLQGPHGPFFCALATMLRSAGATVTRVGFNAGDLAFWQDTASYVPFTAPPTDWPDTCRQLMQDKGITDLVLYGDTRRHHAQAIAIAKDLGLTIHAFEEGYLRPYWITYERDGTNGHSRLMDLDMATITTAMNGDNSAGPSAPTSWGDMRQHIFYGALYHWFVLFRNKHYPYFQSHRPGGIWRETLRYSVRLATTARVWAERNLATRRIRRSGRPFHLALMQLEHDANFRYHSQIDTQVAFMEQVISAFAQCQSTHHLLVFKEHPLESATRQHRKTMRAIATAHGVADRVHYVRGGKLAPLMDHARTAITVNSTSAQQALWRGIPVRIFGRAIYGKAEFVSDLPLVRFFDEAPSPDIEAYRVFRNFLLQTSQIPGGFYARRGRALLLRQITDRMLSVDDPYDVILKPHTTPKALRVVR